MSGGTGTPAPSGAPSQPSPAPQARPSQGSDAEKHITINSILLFILGGLTLVFGLIAAIAAFAAGAFVDQYDSSGAAGYWTRFGGLVMLLFALIGGVPPILAGIGVSRRQEWGRILALIVAGLHGLYGLTLLSGNVTAILSLGYAVYAFISLLQPDVAALFHKQASPA